MQFMNSVTLLCSIGPELFHPFCLIYAIILYYISSMQIIEINNRQMKRTIKVKVKFPVKL